MVLGMFALAAEVVLRIRHATVLEELSEKAGADRDLVMRGVDDQRLIYGYNPDHEVVNEHGYIGINWTKDKPDGVYRIVVIGDSVAAGQGASWNNKFAWILERKLNEAVVGGHRYEVYLMAVTGYSTAQELVVMDEHAMQWNPDLVLWSYVLNDPAHPVYHDANGELGVYYHRPRSHVMRAIAQAGFGAREKMLVKRHVPKGTDPNHWNWHRMLHACYWPQISENIREIGRISKEHQVPTVFAIHPIFSPGRDFDNYPYKRLHNELRKLARDEGKIIPIDLLYAYEGHSQEDVRLHTENDPAQNGYYDPWHYNDLGHELAAELLFEFLSKGITEGFESIRRGYPPPKVSPSLPAPAVSETE